MVPHWFKAFRLQRQHAQQRRRIVRFFDCTWESEWGRQRSRISSLSTTGCYVEERFTVPPEGNLVPELTVSLPTGEVCVQGLVLDSMPGIGFAVRFTKIDVDTQTRLAATVEQFRRCSAT